MIWIHHSIRSSATDFQPGSCVFWETSACAPSHPSLKTPWQPLMSFLMRPDASLSLTSWSCCGSISKCTTWSLNFNLVSHCPSTSSSVRAAICTESYFKNNVGTWSYTAVSDLTAFIGWDCEIQARTNPSRVIWVGNSHPATINSSPPNVSWCWPKRVLQYFSYTHSFLSHICFCTNLWHQSEWTWKKYKLNNHRTGYDVTDLRRARNPS